MKNTYKILASLFILLVSALLTVTLPSESKASPYIYFTNGSIVHQVPNPPCPCTYNFNVDCNDVLQFEGGGDVTFTANLNSPAVTVGLGAPNPLPPGLTFNPNTGVLTWTNIPYLVAGFFRFDIMDINGDTLDHCYIDYDWVLPVELNSFVSVIQGNDVTLRWTTTSETNNSRFDIERANGNSSEWNKIGTVSGSGTSHQPISYSFADRGMNVGKYNYRLKQVDFNGNFKYYNLGNEVVIGVPVKFDLSQNYPNPFNPSTKIDFELARDGNVALNVYDMSGKLVSELAGGFKTAGYYSVQFNASNLASGIYYYKIQYSGDQPFEKVMKMALVK